MSKCDDVQMCKLFRGILHPSAFVTRNNFHLINSLDSWLLVLDSKQIIDNK